MIRLIGYFLALVRSLLLGTAAAVAIYLGGITKDLPDYEVLANYAPPVTTRFHAGNGALMAEYARERRCICPFRPIPDRVKAAFISAEDKNFYRHRCRRDGPCARHRRQCAEFRPGRRPVGASTITQQVAKNFLLSSDRRSIARSRKRSSPSASNRPTARTHSRALSQRDFLRAEFLLHRARR